MRARFVPVSLVFLATGVGYADAQQSFFRLFGGGDDTPAVLTPGTVTRTVAPLPIAAANAAGNAATNAASSSSFNPLRWISNISLPGLSSSSNATAYVPPPPIGPVLPGQHPDAYGPRLPTTVLPPPEHPDAFAPLPPIPQPW
jgi:hypothetical protein